MESEEFWEDKDLIVEHYAELQKRYSDRWVAVVGKRVVSHGKNRGEVRRQAIKLTGRKHIPLIFVKSRVAIY